MTTYEQWCEPLKITSVGSHSIGVLVSNDDELGIGAVAAHLPSRYAKTESLARIAERSGKAKVSEFLRNKLPQTQRARSGDLGEILATAYVEEESGYIVGPSRLIHRDHQEWAMRGDDVLGAKFGGAANVLLIKGEAKSRTQALASAVEEAREGLQRENGLPSQHSLTQFADRLLHTSDDALGEAILDLQLAHGVRPGIVTHLMFLFAGNDPSNHVTKDLSDYSGVIVQQAVILRVRKHQDFVRMTFEKAITNGA